MFCDNVKRNISNFLSEQLKINKEKFISFDQSAQRVDDFYFNASVDMKNYLS